MPTPQATAPSRPTGTVPAGLPDRPLRPTGKRSRTRDGGAALAERDGRRRGAHRAARRRWTSGKGKKAKKTKKPPGRPQPVRRSSWNYLTQVVAELRKVIWPNRKQMVSYTTVVLVFLAFMVTLIGLVDLGLAKLVLLVFG